MITLTFTETFVAILQTEMQYTRDGEHASVAMLHKLGIKLITGEVTPEWVVANFKLVGVGR